jgi:hypothetical protein
VSIIPWLASRDSKRYSANNYNSDHNGINTTAWMLTELSGTGMLDIFAYSFQIEFEFPLKMNDKTAGERTS